VQSGGIVELSAARVEEVEGPGIVSGTGGTVRSDALTIERTTFAGVVVGEGTFQATDLVIEGIEADASFGGGLGIWAEDTLGGAVVDIVGGSIAGAPYAAVWLVGGGGYHLADLDLAGGPGVAVGTGTVHGNAVYARAGEVTVSGGRFSGSRVAVLLDDAGAAFDGVSWSGNTVDLKVQACSGRVVAGYEDAAVVELCPRYDEPVAPLAFDLALFEAAVGDE
jgi:hypothetical protein